MQFDFGRVNDRTGTYTMKYDDEVYFRRLAPGIRLDKDTIRLLLADMDFRCAPAITKALHRVADFGTFGYTTADADPEYRNSIIRWYAKRYHMELKPEWIIHSNGALDGVGRVWEKWELERMADVCRANGVVIVSDEIHSDIVRSGVKHLPILQAVEDSSNLVMVSGANKSFNLMGLQCAYSVIPDDGLRKKFLDGYQTEMLWLFLSQASA